LPTRSERPPPFIPNFTEQEFDGPWICRALHQQRSGTAKPTPAVHIDEDVWSAVVEPFLP
jgi:hypothetical protein